MKYIFYHNINDIPKNILTQFDKKIFHTNNSIYLFIDDLLSGLNTKTYVILVVMDMIIMDTYLLARLFKPYTKNIFIYAGETHILRYQTFFDKILKNNPIDLGKQISYRCIKIKEITL